MRPTRPVLRYFGGKYRIRSWIVSCLPPHLIYVEPYGGAGSILLAKTPSHAEVYNDLDGEVVNLFRVLRSPTQSKRLRVLLEKTPFSRAEFEFSYKAISRPIESARRLVVRCFLGFGASAHNSARRTGFRSKAWRTRQTGVDDWRTYPVQIQRFCDRLKHCLVEQRDAAWIIEKHDSPDTLFYVDPPYVRSTRKLGKGQYRFEMDDAAHRVLAAQLRACSGMVVLSGYDCALYQELYGDWTRLDEPAMSDGAGKRIESLWLNPAAALAKRAARIQYEMGA